MFRKLNSPLVSSSRIDPHFTHIHAASVSLSLSLSLSLYSLHNKRHASASKATRPQREKKVSDLVLLAVEHRAHTHTHSAPSTCIILIRRDRISSICGVCFWHVVQNIPYFLFYSSSRRASSVALSLPPPDNSL